MHTHPTRFAVGLGAAIVGFAATASAATAQSAETARQEVIPEIVVTADYRLRSINDVPLSLSVVDEESIDKRNASHLEELLGMVPDLSYAGGTSRARFFQIRGVGDLEQYDAPLNSSVGLVIDGVDFSGAGSIATLFDVKQVELLRGPQGTRYGANALAGLINITTNDPTESFEASLRADAANYDSYSLGGIVSGPINDRLLYRLGAQSYRSDGFMRNTYRHEDTNDRDELTLRSKLRWLPTDDLTVDFKGSYVNVDDGYDAWSLDNVRKALSDQPGKDKQKSYFGDIRARWHAAPAFDVEGNVGLSNSDIDYRYDEDWTFVGFCQVQTCIAPGYSSTDNYIRNRETISAEVRLVSNEAGRLFRGRSDWVFGLYEISRSVDLRRIYTFLPGPFTSDYGNDRFALYGQLETALYDRFTLTTGLRWERYDAHYHDSDAVFFDPEENLWGGRAVLDYRLGENAMLYAGVARGYKPGGFNTDGTLDADLRRFDSEYMWSYEIGMKGSWFADVFGARIAAFYMARDDVQIPSSVVRVRSDGSSEFIAYTGNAASGTNKGIELELNVLPIPALNLFANVALLRTEYDNFVNAAGEDLSGRDEAYAPHYQFYVGGEYDFLENFFVRLALEGRDSFYYADRHNGKSDPYRLLSAAIGFERGSVGVTLWGRNLTDENYHVRGFYFGNDPRNGYIDEVYTQLAEPRRIGGTISVSF